MVDKSKKIMLASLAGFLAIVIIAGAIILAVVLSNKEDEVSWQRDGYYGVLSFNLRYDIAGIMAIQYTPDDTENGRGPRMLKILDKYKPDLIGFQEATDSWMKYLRPTMAGIGYDYEGLGRVDGKDDPNKTGDSNEFSAIFYKTEKFEKLEGGTFWLSVTPDVTSGSEWEASHSRVCSFVVLKDKDTGETTIFYNTHLDHTSKRAQLNGFRIIEMKIAGLLDKYSGAGVIGSGDFNTASKDNNDAAYIPATYNLMVDRFDDARTIAKCRVVDRNTFTGYAPGWDEGAKNNDAPSVDTDGYPIDYILTGKDMYDVDLYTVCDDHPNFVYLQKQYTGHPVSDHYPIFALVKKVNSVRGESDGATALAKADTVTDVGQAGITSKGIIEGLSAYENLARDAVVVSEMKTSVATVEGLENILKDDQSTAKLNFVSADAQASVFWELSFTLKHSGNIRAIGITVPGGDAVIPEFIDVAAPASRIDWGRIGGTVGEKIQAGSTVYYIFDKSLDIQNLKVYFAGAKNHTEIQNISIYGVKANGISQAVPTFLSGPKPEESAVDGSRKLFDNNTSSKLYINANNTPNLPGIPVVFMLEKPVVIKNYSIFNAEDNFSYPDRTVRGWRLSGSNDGSTWATLSELKNQELEHTNYKEHNFEIDEIRRASYRFYKFDLLQIGTGNRLQISELQLFYTEETGALEEIDAVLRGLSDITAYSPQSLNEFFTALKAIDRSATDTEQISAAAAGLSAALAKAEEIKPSAQSGCASSNITSGAGIPFLFCIILTSSIFFTRRKV